MKKCPICGAIAFDDARTCFGCLHEFRSDDGCESAPAPLNGEGGAQAFLVKFVPVEKAGLTTWSCEVSALSEGETT